MQWKNTKVKVYNITDEGSWVLEYDSGRHQEVRGIPKMNAFVVTELG